MNIEKLTKILKIKQTKLKDIPIIYGLDFRHTLPMLTIPIGGEININTSPLEMKLITH